VSSLSIIPVVWIIDPFLTSPIVGGDMVISSTVRTETGDDAIGSHITSSARSVNGNSRWLIWFHQVSKSDDA
jgi:hypothetical protein